MSMRLSKSKINSYKTCPLKFKYIEIDKLPPKSENEAFIIGGNVHKIAEEFIKSDARCDKEHILDNLKKLEDKYEDDYEDHCINLAKFFECMFFKKGFKFFMAEDYLISEERDFSGLADLVLEDSEGKLFVIDYKTGKSSNVQNYKLELCYYKMLIEEKYPKKEVKYAGIFFTKDGKLSALEFVEDEKDTENEFCTLKDYQYAINYIDTVRLAIKAGRFPARRNHYCKYCDYQEECAQEEN